MRSFGIQLGSEFSAIRQRELLILAKKAAPIIKSPRTSDSNATTMSNKSAFPESHVSTIPAVEMSETKLPAINIVCPQNTYLRCQESVRARVLRL